MFLISPNTPKKARSTENIYFDNLAVLQYKHLINIRYCSIEHFCQTRVAAFTCHHSSHRRNCFSGSIVEIVSTDRLKKLSQQIDHRNFHHGSIVEIFLTENPTLVSPWLYNYHIYGRYHSGRHTDILGRPCCSWVLTNYTYTFCFLEKDKDKDKDKDL